MKIFKKLNYFMVKSCKVKMEILTMNDKYIKRLIISYFIISQAFPNRTSFYKNYYK